MSNAGRPPPVSERGREGHTVSLDDVFGALAAQRRRAVIHALAEHPEGASVDTLVEQLVVWEADVCPTTPPDHAERVATSLRHAHLPKLDALGVVDFDSRSGAVRFGGHAAVEEWLKHAAALSLPGTL
jgi:DNA-binding transcriptional ArsR family regulator